MADILKSDIFFVITTVAIGALSIAALILLIYLIRIARNADKLSQVVREEGEEMVRDIGAVRAKATEESLSLLTRLSRIFGSRGTNRKRYEKNKDKTKEKRSS